MLSPHLTIPTFLANLSRRVCADFSGTTFMCQASLLAPLHETVEMANGAEKAPMRLQEIENLACL